MDGNLKEDLLNKIGGVRLADFALHILNMYFNDSLIDESDIRGYVHDYICHWIKEQGLLLPKRNSDQDEEEATWENFDD